MNANGWAMSAGRRCSIPTGTSSSRQKTGSARQIWFLTGTASDGQHCRSTRNVAPDLGIRLDLAAKHEIFVEHEQGDRLLVPLVAVLAAIGVGRCNDAFCLGRVL